MNSGHNRQVTYAYEEHQARLPHRPGNAKSQLKSWLCVDWLREEDLNLRPLGYEPNELPDCSIAHRNYNTGFAISFGRQRFSVHHFLLQFR